MSSTTTGGRADEGAPGPMCTQMWRDDDDELQFCGLERGHSGECATEAGWLYSETVEMV